MAPASAQTQRCVQSAVHRRSLLCLALAREKRPGPGLSREKNADRRSGTAPAIARGREESSPAAPAMTREKAVRPSREKNLPSAIAPARAGLTETTTRREPPLEAPDDVIARSCAALGCDVCSASSHVIHGTRVPPHCHGPWASPGPASEGPQRYLPPTPVNPRPTAPTKLSTTYPTKTEHQKRPDYSPARRTGSMRLDGEVRAKSQF